MKRSNKTILFFLVLILFLLLSYGTIESVQWNVRKIASEKKEIQGEVDLGKLRRNLNLILSLEIKKSETTWGRNPFEVPLELQSTKSHETQEITEILTIGALPKLRGIVINGRKALAIIDEKLVKVGDHIAGRRVEKIEMGKVTLRTDQTSEILVLD